MRRPIFRLLGFALAVALTAPVPARAQEDGPPPLVTFGLPAVPKLEAPMEPATLTEAPKVDVPISPNTGMPRLEQPKEGNNIGMAQLAIESNEYIDPRYVLNSQHPDDMGLWERARNGTGEQIHRLVRDYKNFYLSENLFSIGASVAVAAPIANTHADQGIRNWYQNGAGQSQGANNTANVFKAFGAYQYAIPVYVSFSLSEHIFPDSPAFATLGEFGNRSLRALAVGAPTVGILQVGLGSSRPFTQDSYWHPFQSSHGASGHAFVGAVPFLTAASMTDNRALKVLLVVGSFGPAWSRIQTDDHYFSQVLLGWTIAYLSVESVNLTECQARHLRIVPVEIPKGVGMGVQIDY